MSRQLLNAVTGFESVLAAGIAETATDAEKTSLCDGIAEVLKGLNCECNGMKRAIDSVSSTVEQRIKAMAVARCVERNTKILAAENGIDVDTASMARISASAGADQILALIAAESIITKAAIEAVVTNEEMAAIQSEEIARIPFLRDPHWHNDISEFVRKAASYRKMGMTPEGLAFPAKATLDLTTLRPDVDDNGEICAWNYEESVEVG